MPVHNCRRVPPPGFTLAEILIAIAIFALLVSAIMGSFSGVFSRTEALAVQRSNDAMARACLMRMATDLGNAYVVRPPFFTPPETAESPSPYRFTAGGASDDTVPRVLLRFASRAHVDFSVRKRKGIAIIRYYIEAAAEEPEPTFRLRRADVLSDAGDLPTLGGDPILCENIQALQLAFLDAEGESFDEWDSSSEDRNFATPRAVRIRLELAGPGGPSLYQTIVALPIWRPPLGKV